MRLIDADALIDFFNNIQEELGEYRMSFKAVNRAIDARPTIEPKHGEWISKDPYWHTAICSNCNKVTMFEEWDEKVIEYDFCPNCGADMRGKGND